MKEIIWARCGEDISGIDATYKFCVYCGVKIPPGDRFDGEINTLEIREILGASQKYNPNLVFAHCDENYHFSIVESMEGEDAKPWKFCPECGKSLTK